MTRPMTAAMQTELAKKTIRPVVIAYLDIASDPIAMWTGNGTFFPSGTGDAVLNGKTFYPEQAFADISDISEDQGIGGPVSVVLKGNDLDSDAMKQIVKDRRQWRGRAAYIWMGLYSDDFAAVIADPVRIKTGVMTRVVVNRSHSQVTVEFTIDTDLGNARSSEFMWTDHQRVYSDDTFSAFVHDLANKPQGFERGDIIQSMDWENNIDEFNYWDGPY